MNDDKQQFVVMDGRRLGMLKSEKFGNFKVGAIRQLLVRAGGRIFASCRRLATVSGAPTRFRCVIAFYSHVLCASYVVLPAQTKKLNCIAPQQLLSCFWRQRTFTNQRAHPLLT